MDTHERYQSNLARTGHNFFSIKPPNSKGWNEEYAPLPPNYHIIDANYFYKTFIHQIDFDLILSQTKFGQYQTFHQLANLLHVPLISLEHTVPNDVAAEEKIALYQQMGGHINVYLWNYSKQAWRSNRINDRIVYHGMDTDFWRNDVPVEQREPRILTVVNDFINRDRECGYGVWRYVTDLMPTSVYGTTPGLSKAAESSAELVNIYNRHQIYVNTSIVSSLPMSLLEAAACGCAIVTTKTCAIPEIFTHNENCLISNDADEMRSYVIELLNDKDKIIRLSNAARKMIEDTLPMDRFVNKWNRIFNEAANTTFKELL